MTRELKYHLTSAGKVFAHKTASPTGEYYAINFDAAHADGKLERGRVWLFGPAGEMFSPAGMNRPRDVAVSDFGHLIVADWLDFDTLSCRIRIFDRSGSALYDKRHRRNAGGVAITATGDTAIYGTMNPRSAVRVVDVGSGVCTATVACACPFYGAEIDLAQRGAWLDTSFPERKRQIVW